MLAHAKQSVCPDDTSWRKAKISITVTAITEGPGPAPTAERVYNNHGAQVVPILPSISSSLAAYVRQDLTDHVSGWPTDRVEHQIRQAEDLFQISHIKYSMVSSQLKGARAGVRHTEIINTHLQARLLCLRQEIEKLEKESKLPDSGS